MLDANGRDPQVELNSVIKLLNMIASNIIYDNFRTRYQLKKPISMHKAPLKQCKLCCSLIFDQLQEHIETAKAVPSVQFHQSTNEMLVVIL